MNRKVVFFFIGLVLLVALGWFITQSKNNNFKKGEIYPFEKWAETLRGGWDYQLVEKAKEFKRIDEGRIIFKPNSDFTLNIASEYHTIEVVEPTKWFFKYSDDVYARVGGTVSGKWGMFSSDSLMIIPQVRNIHGSANADHYINSKRVIDVRCFTDPKLNFGDYTFLQFNSRKIVFKEKDYYNNGDIYVILSRSN